MVESIQISEELDQAKSELDVRQKEIIKLKKINKNLQSKVDKLESEVNPVSHKLISHIILLHELPPKDTVANALVYCQTASVATISLSIYQLIFT